MADGTRISMDMAATTVILIIALFAIAPAVSALLAELSVEYQTRESDVIAIGNIKDIHVSLKVIEYLWAIGLAVVMVRFYRKVMKSGGVN